MDEDYQSLLEQTYLAETGRPPDPEGAAYWGNLLATGQITPDQLSAAFSSTPEGTAFDARTGAAVTGGTDFTDLLNKTYLEETGRAPDEEGKAYWNNLLATGQITPDQLSAAFSGTPEGSGFDRKALLNKTYLEETGRAPDDEGFAYWDNLLATGQITPDQLSALFSGTPEGTAFDRKVRTNEVKTAADTRAADVFNKLDLGSFPITKDIRVNERGETVQGVKLNLPTRAPFSLGIGNFSPIPLTSYQQNFDPANVFGGPSAQGIASTGVGLGTQSSPVPVISPDAAMAATNLGAAPNIGTGTTVPAPAVNEVSPASNVEPVLGTGAVGLAQGGMIMSDPVMRRAMVRGPGPVSSKGYGITSNVTTPDENAMAMQTMFQPQGFRDGGPVQYFQEGGEAEAVEEPAPLTPIERLRAQTRTSEPRFKSVMDVYREGRMLPIDREQEYTGQSMRDLEEGVNPSPSRSMGDVVRDTARGVGDAVRGSTQGIGDFFDSIAERAKRNREAMNRSGPIVRMRSKPDVDALTERAETEARTADLQRQASAQMAQRRQDIDDADRQRDNTAADAAKKAAADRQERAPDAERGAPVKDRLTLRLDELKAERQANKAQRRENQLLALMQAGFAAAAGRSPNALANIAAGGASGVATLADLEKGRRAEDTALRREILETELAGERTRETAAERQAAREERTLSREQTGLRSQAEINARREGQIENTRLRLEALVKDPLVSDTDKARYRSQLEGLDRELERRALEEARLSRAILPPNMRQGSGSFPARIVGSSPTTQR